MAAPKATPTAQPVATPAPASEPATRAPRARKTTPAATTAVAVRKPTAGAVTTWAERLKAKAAEQVAQEQSVTTGNFVTVRAGQLSYSGAAMANNELECVVLDSVMENTFYRERFDADNPASPVCFAFGRDDREMAPHEQSPEKQAEQCKGCPQNEFNTASEGKGKACQNRRRLMIVPVDVLNKGPDAIAKSEIAFFKIPVTSVKGWAAYVRLLAATQGRPPLAAVTKIKVVPDPKTQFRVLFTHEANIDSEELLNALDAKSQQHLDEMTKPYDVIEAKEKPSRQGKRAPVTATPAKKPKY